MQQSRVNHERSRKENPKGISANRWRDPNTQSIKSGEKD